MKLHASVALLLLVLAGCAAHTPYQPEAAGSSLRGGYSERRLSRDTFEIGFSATRATGIDVVERFLLYRAAELTIEQGFDWFEVSDSALEGSAYTYLSPNDRYRVTYGGGYEEWRRYWRFFRYRFGAEEIEGDPLWLQKAGPKAAKRIEARTVIRMRRGAMPAGLEGGFDARSVIADLSPAVRPNKP